VVLKHLWASFLLGHLVQLELIFRLFKLNSVHKKTSIMPSGIFVSDFMLQSSAVIVGNSSETCNNIQNAQSRSDEVQPQHKPKRPPSIEIAPDATVGATDADAEVADISSRMDMDLPMISVQVASPMVISPGEEEGGLCSAMEKYANAWTGNFNIDETDVDADDGKKSDVTPSQHESQKDVDDADLSEADDRPLSPTDYTLEDESDVNQLDTQDAYQPMLLDCRAPSPSEFSLLTESAEENELHRLTHNAIPDDVFAIPDPSPSSAEMNMYLAMQYDHFACGHHPDGAGGTNIYHIHMHTDAVLQSFVLCNEFASLLYV